MVALEVLGEYSDAASDHIMYKAGKNVSDFHHIPGAISDQTVNMSVPKMDCRISNCSIDSRIPAIHIYLTRMSWFFSSAVM